MKTKVNPFVFRHTGNVVQVFYGNPDEPESENVLSIDQVWVPALIAVLKASQGKR
jgi:hypothetical protein